MFILGLSVWLVAPSGFEEYTSAVIAKDKAEAIRKASATLKQYSINLDEVGYKALNLTDFFASSGYDLMIARNNLPKGTYH